jgi:uncharacterized membrane protein HdeD (DUF308 family)
MKYINVVKKLGLVLNLATGTAVILGGIGAILYLIWQRSLEFISWIFNSTAVLLMLVVPSLKTKIYDFFQDFPEPSIAETDADPSKLSPTSSAQLAAKIVLVSSTIIFSLGAFLIFRTIRKICMGRQDSSERENTLEARINELAATVRQQQQAQADSGTVITAQESAVTAQFNTFELTISQLSDRITAQEEVFKKESLSLRERINELNEERSLSVPAIVGVGSLAPLHTSGFTISLNQSVANDTPSSVPHEVSSAADAVAKCAP